VTNSQEVPYDKSGEDYQQNDSWDPTFFAYPVKELKYKEGHYEK